MNPRTNESNIKWGETLSAMGNGFLTGMVSGAIAGGTSFFLGTGVSVVAQAFNPSATTTLMVGGLAGVVIGGVSGGFAAGFATDQRYCAIGVIAGVGAVAVALAAGVGSGALTTATLDTTSFLFINR